MRIRNTNEYLAAIDRAAFFIDNGFGGSFEKEKHYRELLKAIIEYDNLSPVQMPHYQMVRANT